MFQTDQLFSGLDDLILLVASSSSGESDHNVHGECEKEPSLRDGARINSEGEANSSDGCRAAADDETIQALE